MPIYKALRRAIPFIFSSFMLLGISSGASNQATSIFSELGRVKDLAASSLAFRMPGNITFAPDEVTSSMSECLPHGFACMGDEECIGCFDVLETDDDDTADDDFDVLETDDDDTADDDGTVDDDHTVDDGDDGTVDNDCDELEEEAQEGEDALCEALSQSEDCINDEDYLAFMECLILELYGCEWDLCGCEWDLCGATGFFSRPFGMTVIFSATLAAGLATVMGLS